MDESSTIAAVATASGRGGIAIVRVSGPDAFAIATRLTGKTPQPGIISYATIRENFKNRENFGNRENFKNRENRENSAIIDSGVVLAFAKPHSYTGEDVIEFQCHGGFVTPQRVLNACFAAGARRARRGEFTERAFLNGRLTLDQAQAVLDLIDARTTRAASSASRILNETKNRENDSRKKNREIYNEILDASSAIEHALDVSEDELPREFFAKRIQELEKIREKIAAILRDFRERRIFREGASVVLVGPPNAGKSSLMNALLHENRAIVSDIPGTTRDTIEEWLDLGGWPVRLSDTAGLRETTDAIEAEGVRRTQALLETADIVVRVVASDEKFANENRENSARENRENFAIEKFANENSRKFENEIVVFSKADLIAKNSRTDGLWVSAQTGEGLNEFREKLIAKLEQLADFAKNDEAFDEISRDGSVLLATDELLREAIEILRATDDLVLAGNVIRRACERLGAAIGETYSDDLLARIFSRFCVGK